MFFELEINKNFVDSIVLYLQRLLNPTSSSNNILDNIFNSFKDTLTSPYFINKLF